MLLGTAKNSSSKGATQKRRFVLFESEGVGFLANLGGFTISEGGDEESAYPFPLTEAEALKLAQDAVSQYTPAGLNSALSSAKHVLRLKTEALRPPLPGLQTPTLRSQQAKVMLLPSFFCNRTCTRCNCPLKLSVAFVITIGSLCFQDDRTGSSQGGNGTSAGNAIPIDADNRTPLSDVIPTSLRGWGEVKLQRVR